MHRRILGAGVWLAGLQALAASPAEPACAPPQRVVERFVDAGCEACWSQPVEPALPAGAWALDWIVPGAQGDAAPLALAALAEGQTRQAAVAARRSLSASAQAEWPLAARPPLHLTVVGGPAWNGYLGLQLSVRGTPPEGAQAYLALVEDLPAGAEGNASARRLVRAVAGPVPLDGGSSRELRALRIPEAAKPERLRGVAWWVDRDQGLQGMAAEDCPR